MFQINRMERRKWMFVILDTKCQKTEFVRHYVFINLALYCFNTPVKNISFHGFIR